MVEKFLQDGMVDGSEMRRLPVDMVNIPLLTGFYASQVVGLGISEPSTVCLSYHLQRVEVLNMALPEIFIPSDSELGKKTLTFR